MTSKHHSERTGSEESQPTTPLLLVRSAATEAVVTETPSVLRCATKVNGCSGLAESYNPTVEGDTVLTSTTIPLGTALDSTRRPVPNQESDGSTDSDDADTCRSIARGLFTLVAVGFTVGLVSTMISSQASHLWSWSTLSSCLGYTYVSMWSVSFYPQLLTNFRRQSTEGLSVEFACLNVLGFWCYTIYNCLLYSSPSIRREYRERHSSNEIPVQFNDVLFAVHALVVSSLTVGQICWHHDRTAQRYRTPQVIWLVSTLLFMMGLILAYPTLDRVWNAPSVHLSPLDYVYVLSYIKMTITFVKYLPQLWLNRSRQSTRGWSVWQIILDFGGGCLSVTQLVLDCGIIQKDWTGLTGNLAKFGLGLISMAFDLIFLYQHYILYSNHIQHENGRRHSDETIPLDGSSSLDIDGSSSLDIDTTSLHAPSLCDDEPLLSESSLITS